MIFKDAPTLLKECRQPTHKVLPILQRSAMTKVGV